MQEEINPFDEGIETEPSVNDAVLEDASQSDSAEGKAEPDSTDETIAEDGEAKGEKVSEEIKDDEKDDSEKEISDEESAKAQEEADKRLNDPNSPKWFKNYVENVYKPNLQKAAKELEVFEPIKNYGEPEKVIADLEILKGLDAVQTNAQGLPEKTVKPFAEKLLETKGVDVVRSVMVEIGKLQSREGRVFFHELMEANGIDPTRLDDHKAFAKNGYRTDSSVPPPEDWELEDIPEHLHSTFSSLSPERREALLTETDEHRNDTLEALKLRADTVREKEAAKIQEQQKAQTEAIQKQQEFRANWDKEAIKIAETSGTAITSSFTEMLVNDAGLSAPDALGQALLIDAAINGTGATGQLAIAQLKAEGITLDDSIKTIFKEWEQEISNLAYFQLAGQTAEAESSKKNLDALQNRLLSKANPIVAQIAQKRATEKKKKSEERNSLIEGVQKTNTGINPSEGVASAAAGVGNYQISASDRERILENPFAD